MKWKKEFKTRFLLFFLIIMLLVNCIPISNINIIVSAANPPGIFLIQIPNDWELAGFNPDGLPVYTPDSLTDFYMPIALKKEDVQNLQNSDIEHTIKHANNNFTNRLRSISFEILESETYYVVLYHMKVIASNQVFSIDFVPKIKGEELGQFAWWNSSWEYKKEITISSAQIRNTLTNFPVLVYRASDSDLAANASNDGYDIAFVDSTETVQYKHEIELFDGDTGELWAWVNVTTLSADVDTTMYMYYGEPGASDQQDITGTWNSDYIMVQHMNGTGNIIDSTIFDNDGTEQGTSDEVTGKIGKAREFSNDYFTIASANNSSLDFKGEANFTIEAWIYPDTIGEDDGIVARWGASGNRQYLLEIRTENDYGKLIVAGSNELVQTANDEIVTGTWQYLVGVADWDTLYMYHNTTTATGDTYTEIADIGERVVEIGTVGGANYFDGNIDEIRISNITRNASWLETCYNNVENKTTFCSFGVEEVGDKTLFPPTFFNATTVPNGNIDLTWTKGINATHTVIEWNTISNWDREDGTEIYNNTGTNYSHTGLTCGSFYYYQACSFNSTTHNYTTSIKTNNISCPGDPTSITSTINGTNLNFSWTNGNYADKTTLVKKTGSLPTSPTDETVIYNNTGTTHVDTDMSYTAYYMIYGWNETVSRHSTGVEAPWGIIVLRAFDVNTTDAIPSWGVIISNSAKTSTYENLSASNSLILNIDEIPYGSDTSFIFNATGYNNRIYYIDTAINTKYSLDAYLCNSIETESYVVRVIDEISNPVETAKIYFKRYINASVGWDNISILLTDPNGYCTISLVPYETYATTVTKTGYVTKTSDIYPLPIIYGDERYHTLLINRESTTYENIFDNITYDIQPTITTHDSAITFYYNITSLDNDLESFSLTVYIYNSTTFTWTTLYTDISTNIGGGSLSYTTSNIAGVYGLKCEFKREGWSNYSFGGDFEYMYLYVIYHNASFDPLIDDIDDLNTMITNVIGVSPVYTTEGIVIAWTSLFAMIGVTFIAFTFAPAIAGFGVMSIAVVIGFFKEPLGLILESDISMTSVVLIFVFGVIVTVIAIRKSR